VNVKFKSRKHLEETYRQILRINSKDR